MSELIVIGYDNETEAEAARQELFGMAKEYLVDVADAVVAHANDNGKVKLNQMVNMWSWGMSGGAFWRSPSIVTMNSPSAASMPAMRARLWP